VEASAFPAPSGLARTRISLGAPLLRLRSDDQLVASFRDGNDDAFRLIYDRYRQRLFAYTRQMLPGSRQDAEDALQDVFVRAFGGLRANDRELALRPWLYRIAHNRCIDELRRPTLPAPELMELVRPPLTDPIAEAEQRESLRRLIADVRRLPEQQRSALLMRELAGMSYSEISDALAVSVPAVKSLLVRARVGLAQAAQARDASCSEVREDLIIAHDRGVRPNGMARRHLRDCPGCREFRGHLRGTSRQFASLLPALGPAGVIAKLLGFGGGAGGGAAAGTGAMAATAGTGGTVASVGVIAAGAGHVATILAAAVVAAGGAVEIQHTIQHTIVPPTRHSHHRSLPIAKAPPPSANATSRTYSYSYSGPATVQPVQVAAVPETDLPTPPATASRPAPAKHAGATTATESSLGGFAGMQPASIGGAVHTKRSNDGATTGSGTGEASTQAPATTEPGTDTGDSASSTGSSGAGAGSAGSGATGDSGSTGGGSSSTSGTGTGSATDGSGSGSGSAAGSVGSPGSSGPSTS
jgi:RNA polymerase sigma factor (sigma-70 family)